MIQKLATAPATSPTTGTRPMIGSRPNRRPPVPGTTMRSSKIRVMWAIRRSAAASRAVRDGSIRVTVPDSGDPAARGSASREPADTLEVGAEGVAVADPTPLVAGQEPLLALLRRPVRPRFGGDLTLDAVVADRRRCVERLSDIRLGQLAQEPGAFGIARPHTRQAVRHELDADCAAL